MKLATFIDYDNLLDRHKSSGILDVVTKALFQTPLSSQNVRGTCDIRIYGGWYEGLTMTGRAQELTGNIGDEFPTIIRVATKSGEVLESVREVYVFKHSFLSMRRIDAKSRKARAVLVRFSKSLASRRHLPSQANVLSTTHRLGMTSKPTAVSDRLTISVSKWGKIFFRAWSNTGPWYPPSAKSFFRNGNLPNKVPRTRTPPSRSWILAGCTMACTNRPTVSTRMWRFLPLIFLPAS